MAEIIHRELFENGEVVGYEYGGRLVRCKDCKFYRKTAVTTMDYFDYIKGNTENKKTLYMCDNDVIDWATPEDYCSLGERREDAGE